MNDKKIIIEGRNIFLREYKEEDLDDYHELISKPEIRKYSIYQKSCSVEESFAELKDVIAEQKAKERIKFIFAVSLKESNQYVGDAGFDIIAKGTNGGIAEIGYFLDEGWWGRGFATEIGDLLIKYCFTHFPFHKIVASCDARNTASEKVMVKCRMRKEGEFRLHRFKDGTWHNELRYSILRNEWENS